MPDFEKVEIILAALTAMCACLTGVVFFLIYGGVL